MSFCWQTCFYLLYQPALNNAKIKNAAARQLKERRAAAFAVKKLRGGSLPYGEIVTPTRRGVCYSHTSSMWSFEFTSSPATSPAAPGVNVTSEPVTELSSRLPASIFATSICGCIYSFFSIVFICLKFITHAFVVFARRFTWAPSCRLQHKHPSSDPQGCCLHTDR